MEHDPRDRGTSPLLRVLDALTVLALGVAIAIGAGLFSAAYIIWVVDFFLK